MTICFSVDELGDSLVGPGELLEGSGGGPRRNGQACADLSVDLSDNLVFVIDGERGIVRGPRGERHRCLLAEHFPELFGEVRRVRGEEAE